MGVLEGGSRTTTAMQGPTFLIEYDNTQNNNNHIHAVWRDFHGDFGVDLLPSTTGRRRTTPKRGSTTTTRTTGRRRRWGRA